MVTLAAETAWVLLVPVLLTRADTGFVDGEPVPGGVWPTAIMVLSFALVFAVATVSLARGRRHSINALGRTALTVAAVVNLMLAIGWVVNLPLGGAGPMTAAIPGSTVLGLTGVVAARAAWYGGQDR